MNLTCWSRRFSSDTGVPMVPFVRCAMNSVFEVCDAFQYEPGTDSSDRESSSRLRSARLGAQDRGTAGSRTGRVLAQVARGK